jgi:DNA mismatch endonuclease (patch repair protein)
MQDNVLMVDIISPEQRSKTMSQIKSKNTSIERVVFSYLRKKGIYFQKHYSRVVGSPDIALPRKKKGVFIDGEFWHGYTLEKRKDKLPIKWSQKIIRNVKRDRSYRKELREGGWHVLRVWEHELNSKHREQTLEKVYKFLTED